MKRIFAALLLLSVSASMANAEIFEWERRVFAGIKKNEPIRILTQDNASGGCWTNAESAQRNLVGAVKEKGFNPTKVNEAHGTPFILLTVKALRMKTGACTGYSDVTISFPVETTKYGQQWIKFTLGSNYGAHPDNFNEWVMDWTEDAAREFRNMYFEAREQ